MLAWSFALFGWLAVASGSGDRRFLFFSPPDHKILVTLNDVEAAIKRPFDRQRTLGSIVVHEGSGNVLRDVQIANSEWISDLVPDLAIDLARGTRLILTDLNVVPVLRVVRPEVLLRFYVELATEFANRPLSDLVEQIDRRLLELIFWRGERFSHVQMEDRVINHKFRFLPSLPRSMTYEEMMACAGSLR